MEFINPFFVTCEHCAIKSSYAVDDLLAYKVVCVKCNGKLTRVSDSLHESMRLHRIESWPMYFIFEGLEQFGVNLDCVGEDDIDTLGTVADFVNLVRRLTGVNIAKDIVSMAIMVPILSKIDADNIVNYRLHDLALIAN